MSSFALNGVKTAVVTDGSNVLRYTPRPNTAGVIIPIPQAFIGNIAYFYPIPTGSTLPSASEMLKGIERVAGQEFDASLCDCDLCIFSSVVLTTVAFEVYSNQK